MGWFRVTQHWRLVDRKNGNDLSRGEGEGGAKDAVGVAPLAVGRCGQGSCSLGYLAAGSKVLEDFCFGKKWGKNSGGDFTRSEREG